MLALDRYVDRSSQLTIDCPNSKQSNRVSKKLCEPGNGCGIAKDFHSCLWGEADTVGVHQLAFRNERSRPVMCNPEDAFQDPTPS